jgi:hypothetical protein
LVVKHFIFFLEDKEGQKFAESWLGLKDQDLVKCLLFLVIIYGVNDEMKWIDNESHKDLHEVFLKIVTLIFLG